MLVSSKNNGGRGIGLGGHLKREMKTCMQQEYLQVTLITITGFVACTCRQLQLNKTSELVLVTVL